MTLKEIIEKKKTIKFEEEEIRRASIVKRDILDLKNIQIEVSSATSSA